MESGKVRVELDPRRDHVLGILRAIINTGGPDDPQKAGQVLADGAVAVAIAACVYDVEQSEIESLFTAAWDTAQVAAAHLTSEGGVQ